MSSATFVTYNRRTGDHSSSCRIVSHSVQSGSIVVSRSEDKETRSMRRLVVGTFVTLDGIMQAPGGPNEDRDGGFQHGGWLVPYFDEKFGEIMTEWTKRADAFLLGRKTFE